MGVDIKLLCLDCKVKIGGWRFHFNWDFAKKLSGKVTKRKIRYLKNLEEKLAFVFGDDYSFGSAKDHIKIVREFFERHIGHTVIITHDHDPSEYYSKDGTPDWEFRSE